MAEVKPGRSAVLLRGEREDYSRLLWAFAFSIVFHLAIWAGHEVGQKYDLWNSDRWPKWLQPPKMISELLKKTEPEKQVAQAERPPLIFVEVNPAVASPEPPKETPYYAAQNSVAANPEPDEETEVPRVDGKQTEVVKTEDVPRQPPVTKLQPALPKPEPEPEPEPKPQPLVKPQPLPQQAPGDLALARPQPEKVEPAEQKPPRPRTIREALARKQEPNRIPGEKMRQEGGVRRRLEVAALDAKATPFGTYDQMLIEAISQRWYSLLDQREYASDARGRVVLQFVLHYNGRVTDMEVSENSAGEVLGLICQKAVMDPAPYGQWPADMRRMMGDTRKIQFTFYYH